MSCVVLFAVLLGCLSSLFFSVNGCQRHSELLAITEDVITLRCSYAMYPGNASITPAWFVGPLNGGSETETTIISNGSEILIDNKNKYNVTDDRENMEYNLQVKTDMKTSSQVYVCGLAASGSVTGGIYDLYSLTVLQHPSCSLTERPALDTPERRKKVILNCSWSPSILPFPILVSWVRVRHPHVLDDESVMQLNFENATTNSSRRYVNLSPQYYGDTFACVARTETSNNTVIGCSYVPLRLPNVTITQNGNSTLGENIMLMCNASGFLTNDLAYTWTVNNVNIIEFDQHHFKVITEDVLQIDSLKYIDNDLDIICSVAEGDVIQSALFPLEGIQATGDLNPGPGLPVIITISVAGCVVLFIIMFVCITIIRRSRNSKTNDNVVTGTAMSKQTKMTRI